MTFQEWVAQHPRAWKTEELRDMISQVEQVLYKACGTEDEPGDPTIIDLGPGNNYGRGFEDWREEILSPPNMGNIIDDLGWVVNEFPDPPYEE